MTGRDLIIYILKNNLEDTEVFDVNGCFIGFLTEGEAAVKLGVGIETVKAMISLGQIKATKIKEMWLVPEATINEIIRKGTEGNEQIKRGNVST